MKYLYSLTLLLLLAQLCVAQQPFADLPAPATNTSHMLAATNPAGDACFFTFTQSHTNYVIVDAQGQQVSMGTYPYNFTSGSSILGVVGQPDGFILYDQLQQEQQLQPYFIESATGKMIALGKLASTPDAKSKLVKSFTFNNKLHQLHINKKTNTLYLSTFSDAAAPQVRSYALQEPRIYDRLFKNGELQLVEPELDQSMHTNFYVNKLYPYPNRLVITFDMFENPDAPRRALTTETLTLDLNSNEATFTRLPYLLQQKGLTFNSYLHQGNLYRFILTRKDLQLEIYNAAESKLQKHYYYAEHDSIRMMHEGVYRIGSHNSWSARPDTLRNTEKVLRKMGNGYPAIAVRTTGDDHVQLLIGTYEPQHSTGQTIAGAAGRGLASAAGPAALPLLVIGTAIQIGAYALADGAGVSTYFTSILSNRSYEPTGGTAASNVQDQIRQYEQQLRGQKVNMAAALLYKHQGQVYYAYIDKKQQRLIISVFGE